MADLRYEWAAVYPHLGYYDPPEAIAWLARAFGFQERVRMAAPDGSFITAKLETPGGGLVMVTTRRDEPSPWLRERVPNLRPPHERPWPYPYHAMSMMVPDVDAHHERAKAEGATIVDPPADKRWGLRVYSAIDLDGHLWEFVMVVRAVEPEAWGAVRVSPASAAP